MLLSGDGWGSVHTSGPKCSVAHQGFMSTSESSSYGYSWHTVGAEQWWLLYIFGGNEVAKCKQPIKVGKKKDTGMSAKGRFKHTSPDFSPSCHVSLALGSLLYHFSSYRSSNNKD